MDDLDFVLGEEVVLTDTPIYATYESKNVVGRESGLFFVYNTIIKNNRIKITNEKNKVGKPVSATGWVNIYDIEK